MKKTYLIAFMVLTMGLAACQSAPSTEHRTAQYTQSQSGIKLKVIKQGSGKTASIDDDLEIRFTSYDHTGKELDGTRTGTPVIVRPSDMFQGLKEGLIHMQEGGVYELYVPANMGYSDDERLTKQPITYRIEVLRVNP